MPIVDRHSLDGSNVTLDVAAEVDLGRPFASFIGVEVDVPINRSARGFGGGGKDYGRSVAAGLEIELTEEYVFQGGLLFVGVQESTDPTTRIREVRRLGIWEGMNSSLKTLVYGETDEIIQFLDLFWLREHDVGLDVIPKDPNSVRIEREGRNAPILVQNVPGLGLLEIRALTAQLARRLPRHRGTPVRGGELFVQGDRSTQLTLLLVGETAVTRLYPNWWEIAGEDYAVDAFSEAATHWRLEG